jgi:hypothetical protein
MIPRAAIVTIGVYGFDAVTFLAALARGYTAEILDLADLSLVAEIAHLRPG